ncbi:MAG: hypothetical protein H6813_00090 [Phycisphaeraceae bacterium]|nr:hypothetical protein [Phycisphaeraceae bacterium]MCB9847515.1 hypothetical protein [Phycisphaeraceae bacterium]
MNNATLLSRPSTPAKVAVRRRGGSWLALGTATAALLLAGPISDAAEAASPATPTVSAADADKRRPAQKSAAPAKRPAPSKASPAPSNRSGGSSANSNSRSRGSSNSGGAARNNSNSRSGNNSADTRTARSRPAARSNRPAAPSANSGSNAGSNSTSGGASDSEAPGRDSAARSARNNTQNNARNNSRNNARNSTGDRRRPAASSPDTDANANAQATPRPDYRYSYDRTKAREDLARNRQRDSAGRADRANRDRRGDNRDNGARSGEQDRRRPAQHPDDYRRPGNNNHNNGSHNNHHNNNSKKIVNNYYYGSSGYHGSWWRPFSYFCPSYSIGYSWRHEGLSFSIGLGGLWDDWCDPWPYYTVGYSSYRPYYGSYASPASVVVIDNDPEVVYVPVEKARPVYDFDAGWEHLATGRDEEALQFFSTRVQRWGDSSAAKAGYAIAAAQMNDRSRAVWSMRRAFRIDDGELGYLPLDTRLLNLAALLESRYAYDAEEAKSPREQRDSLFMVAALRYILHDPSASLDAAYAARDAGDRDSSLDALIRAAETDLDY